MQRALLTLLLALAPALTAAETIRFGVVPQFEARRIERIWQPILAQLSHTTGHQFELHPADSIPVFEQAFRRGDFDFAYMNPWHAVVAHDAQQYRPVLRDAKRQLRGILVVRSDSAIEHLGQLQGREVAFPAPNALGASLLMRAELKTLYNIDVIPRYVQTHSSVYLNVALQATAAGGGVMRTLREQSDTLQNRLRVLYQTRPTNPHPIVAHPRVPEPLVAALIAQFQAMGEDSTTQALLAEVPMNKITRTDMSDYRMLREWDLDAFYVAP